ncbi:probable cytochrome P450 6d4 [Coccinella septempunctata]|uniref:probable cytochrome P450 6d4 n=1 Tax=Coccinella septempunctata TaxID=41139 RepID=UPI001D085FD6|nr:probable cytochrome P450 6d4 [Coccinella septempunctata]
MFVTNVLAAIACLLLLRFYLHFKNIYRYWQNRGLKVIEPIYFPFGNFWTFIKRDKGVGPILAEWYEEVDSEVIGLYALNEPILLVKDPDIIRDILVKDFNSFTDRGVYMDKNDSLTGQLWKLPGHKWKPLRTKMSTCFTIGKLKMMFSNLLNAGEEMEIFLEKAAAAESIDVDDLCKRFTADIVAQSIFGVEVKSFKDKDNDFLKMLKCLTTGFNRKNMIKFSLQIVAPKFYDFFSFVKFETVNQVAISFVYKMVEKIMEFREATGAVGKDMMQLLIQLKKFGKVDAENGEKLPDSDVCLTMDEVVAQAYTYFFTGSETASSTLTLLLYECSLNQDIQRKVQEDIDKALSSSGGQITYEAILEMKYLNMVVSETLRKYPILQFLMRKSVEDYKLEKIGLELEKGTRIYISVQGLQRDPKYYPDPEKFDPERFSKENQANRHPMTYMPFGEGPRNCIGKRLGYFMVVVGAIHIFRNFNLSTFEDIEVPLKLNPYSYTIRPVNPLLLKVSQR